MPTVLPAVRLCQRDEYEFSSCSQTLGEILGSVIGSVVHDEPSEPPVRIVGTDCIGVAHPRDGHSPGGQAQRW
jgi:hypothetical protein